MQRVCPKCNSLVNGEGSFCPTCGEPLQSAVQLEKDPMPQSQPMPGQSIQFSAPQQDVHQASMPNYGAPQQPMYSAQPAYNYNAPAQQNQQEMSLGQWVGTIILTTWFGLISIILTAVWAFGSSAPVAKKRYCQALFIFQIIGVVFTIIFTVSLISYVSTHMYDIEQFIEQLTREVNNSSDYWAYWY